MNNTLDLSQLTDDELRDKFQYHVDQFNALSQILGSQAAPAASNGDPTSNPWGSGQNSTGGATVSSPAFPLDYTPSNWGLGDAPPVGTTSSGTIVASGFQNTALPGFAADPSQVSAQPGNNPGSLLGVSKYFGPLYDTLPSSGYAPNGSFDQDGNSSVGQSTGVYSGYTPGMSQLASYGKGSNGKSKATPPYTAAGILRHMSEGGGLDPNPGEYTGPSIEDPQISAPHDPGFIGRMMGAFNTAVQPIRDTAEQALEGAIHTTNKPVLMPDNSDNHLGYEMNVVDSKGNGGKGYAFAMMRPRYADVDSNISAAIAAKTHADDTVTGWSMNPMVAPLMRAAKYATLHQWFFDHVNTGAPMDYKQLALQHPDLYPQGSGLISKLDNFGNFNYGAVGAALGFGLEELKSAALRARARAIQALKGSGSFIDDPVSAHMIEAGFRYYADPNSVKLAPLHP